VEYTWAWHRTAAARTQSTLARRYPLTHRTLSGLGDLAAELGAGEDLIAAASAGKDKKDKKMKRLQDVIIVQCGASQLASWVGRAAWKHGWATNASLQGRGQAGAHPHGDAKRAVLQGFWSPNTSYTYYYY
jgi:hypothetical protein